ncbi:DUF6113 family protein [Streptomyces sp. NPDC006879]|uniref:DUF6113 family protein n=1 Tax=Streptomyces sp. NPDC006879 TaxID=3364767 RepID=UPI0036C0B852
MSGTVNAGRIAAWLALFLGGALLQAAGALVIGAWFPLGLLLALLATFGYFVGARIAARDGIAVAAAGAGWLIAFFVLGTPRPEGDFIFAESLGTYLYLLVGVLAAVMCATSRAFVDSAAVAPRSRI